MFILLSVRTSMKMHKAPFRAQKTLENSPFYLIICISAGSQSTESLKCHVIMDIFSELKNWNAFLTISHF